MRGGRRDARESRGGREGEREQGLWEIEADGWRDRQTEREGEEGMREREGGREGEREGGRERERGGRTDRQTD